METRWTCRSCDSGRLRLILEFGRQPLANSLLREDQFDQEEVFPLTLVFCEDCSLVQILETVEPEKMFRNYLYFSSISPTIIENARRNVERQVIRLGPNALVIEAASNDGYLLKFYKNMGIRVIGVDPAKNIAAAANADGVPTIPEFFTERLAEELASNGNCCDVFHANNVLAHVQSQKDFLAGVRRVLKPEGVAIIEVPYLGSMIKNCEFDTVYHEHLCYFSLYALDRLARLCGLYASDVERIPIHGGSLRVFLKKSETAGQPTTDAVRSLMLQEAEDGMHRGEYYQDFAARVNRLGIDLWRTLYIAKKMGHRMGAYGASAKSSTLLNYFMIDDSVIDFVVDKSPHKQGLYTPGTHIPIVDSSAMFWAHAPKFMLLLAWNFKGEIMRQNKQYLDDGGAFIVPIPEVEILSSLPDENVV
jgi:SAM-dependent methyltransferase